MKNLDKMVTIVFVNFFLILLILLGLKNYDQIKALVTGVSVTPTVEQLAELGLTPSVAMAPTATNVPPSQAASVVVPKPTATPKPVVPQPTKDTRCIIIVSGARYNVTQLRNTHSGGNIFKCGADMTAVYKGQHGSSTSLIARYRI
jgi:hypothetical protein